MYVGIVATNLFGNIVFGIVSGVLTILIIFFGEILPKIIGENNSEKISLAVAPIIVFFIKVFQLGRD